MAGEYELDDAQLAAAMDNRDQLGILAEQAEAERKAKEARRARAQSVADKVGGYVKEAVQARENSGVERRWREDLVYYYGSLDILRSVRGVIDSALSDKATAKGNNTERTTRSTINVNITRPKVNAAFSRLSDMLLPVDDRNFSIEHSPKPDLGSSGDTEDEPGKLVAGPGQSGTVMTMEQRTEKIRKEAKKRAANMQRTIDDNLTECDYNSECRKALWQAACLGTGIIKGPVVAERTKRAWREIGNDRWDMDTQQDIVPESRWVDIWNAYPDATAGSNAKNMRYFVERDEYNARMLRALRGQPGYLTDQIDMILKETPMAVTRMRTERNVVEGSFQQGDLKTYEVFTVTCELTKGDLEDLEVQGLGGFEDEEILGPDGEVMETKRHYLGCPENQLEDPIGACVVICNGKPIQAFINPLKSGDLGYDIFTYEPVHGQMFGLGVAYLLRSPQRVLSTAWRMVMDNAALTVGGLVVVERDGIEPTDGNWNLYGGKVFYKTTKFANGAGGKVEDAFKVYNMESQLEQLERIIQLALKFAEDETSLPSLMEGNQGAAPDTVGGMTLLMNSANTVLKMLAKRFDDCITRPHISRYYEWHMLHNPDPTIKGDFNVMARGSSHLVVRDLQRQSLIGFMQYSSQPHLAIFFKTGGYDGLRKVAESNSITPDDVLIPEEEAPKVWQQFQAAQAAAAQAQSGGAQQTPPPDNEWRITIAREANESKERIAALQRDIKLMEFAHEKGITLADAQREMAAITIKERGADSRQARELAHAAQSPTHQGI